MTNTEPMNTVTDTHSCRHIGPDSWWVYRHRFGADGQPLPWGRVVHYCRTEDEAKSWIRQSETVGTC